MKLSGFALLTDENIHPDVVDFLRQQGLDVMEAATAIHAGAPDEQILGLAHELGRLVITHDSDFGSLAIAAGRPLIGVVYLRPGHIRSSFTIGTLRTLLNANLDLDPPFIVVAVRSMDRVRVRIRTL